VRELVKAERADPGARNKSGEVGALAGSRAASGSGSRPAPAPGEGKGASRFWDEAARPVAPPAPPGHQYSARGRAVGRHLAEVHDHLRHELDQILDLLEQVKQGSMTAGAARAELNKMTLRQNNWTLGTYCESYCQ